MILDSIKTQLQESQAAFLDILDRADAAVLYQRSGDEWTLAEVLVHMAEARTFYADAIGQLHANPGITIGRDLTHTGRTQTIIKRGNDNSAEIRQLRRHYLFNLFLESAHSHEHPIQRVR